MRKRKPKAETVSECVRRYVRSSSLTARQLSLRTKISTSSMSRFLAGRGIWLADFDRLAHELRLRIVQDPPPDPGGDGGEATS